MNEQEPTYTKHTTHTFKAYGETWAITEFSDTWCAFEETRKNGQEDCHMYGEANLIDGKWVLDDQFLDTIKMYSGEGAVTAIEAVFNEHGMPKGTL